MQYQLEQLKEILLGVWNKKHYVIISTWLICPIGWFVVASLPSQYEASARVYVDTQSLLRPLMKGVMVETDPDLQIQLMIKTLLSRSNLERIVKMTEMDSMVKNSDEFESLIEDLKDDIVIYSSGQENIYTLSIKEKTPQLAQSIIEAALAVFIDNTLSETRSDTESAQFFLQQQIEDYEQRLAEAESRLAEFKQKYIGIMPGNSKSFYSSLEKIKLLLKETNLEVLETQTRLSSAQEQLSKEFGEQDKISDNVMEDGAIITTYDESILSLQANLDNLLIGYTEQHPDVREVRRRLIELKAQRRKEIENYYTNNNGESNSLNATRKNPVYQAMKIDINKLENEIASLRVRALDYQREVDELNSKIHILPKIEVELVALNRDYEINKTKYEELLSRKATAALAKEADATAERIQFRIIDPPRAPLKPVGPYRMALFFAVLIAGFSAGPSLVILMLQINPLVMSAPQLSRMVGLPTFGIITASEKLQLASNLKQKNRIFHISNLLILLMLMAFISYFWAANILQPQQLRNF
ncbi:GNVR domain-containing protein [Thalassotalea fonticola]|uniref:GNVR domain-containing protein n=1 Tax=Thalassotalea fonticola TaxID=3065649 RepID=A0ABZ0GMR2_9GAMM|nr:GNVR domain-containing protein [Colwelliaceae bacterium S1-1]